MYWLSYQKPAFGTNCQLPKLKILVNLLWNNMSGKFWEKVYDNFLGDAQDLRPIKSPIVILISKDN